MVTPELQLIPRILRNDVRLRPTANATQRRVQIETLPAGNGECTPVNGNIHQCGRGWSCLHIHCPRRRSVCLQAAPPQRRLGTRTHTSPSSLMGSVLVGKELFSTSPTDFNELQVVANVTAGRHTFRANFDNDWCGGCGGNPDGRTR